jgi:hypothetical protein
VAKTRKIQHLHYYRYDRAGQFPQNARKACVASGGTPS